METFHFSSWLYQHSVFELPPVGPLLRPCSSCTAASRALQARSSFVLKSKETNLANSSCCCLSNSSSGIPRFSSLVLCLRLLAAVSLHSVKT